MNLAPVFSFSIHCFISLNILILYLATIYIESYNGKIGNIICIQEWFRLWILDSLKEKRDDKELAIVTRTGSYTFSDVWAYSELIARDIEATEKMTPVVLYGDKNLNMIPTMIAAIKTGRAYVPVDVSFPVERLQLIAFTVDACAIYNYSGKELDLPFIVRDEAYVQNELYTGEVPEDIPQSHWVREEDACYILFTSGSTGKPKGVPITMSNLMNFMDYDLLIPEKMGQNVLCQVSFSFDISGQMIYRYMNMGKTLICIDKGLLDDGHALVEWMAKNRISLWVSTPSFIDLCRKCKSFDAKALPELQTFYLGGEILSKNTVSFIRRAFPDSVIYNVYGPTEATIWICGCVVTEEMQEDADSIPIGTVMEEADYVIESEDKCPIHTKDNPGELILISKSVGQGYYKDPEKTAKSFFRAEDGRMAYRTGDLVYEKNGLLYFVGRKDFQIKLSGYRIEMDDIASNLDRIPFIVRSAVMPVYHAEGTVEYLAAFVVLRQEYQENNPLKNIIEIKNHLKKMVPAYMVPQKIVILNQFPLNVNGKIDRNELKKRLDASKS